ncbi:MAG: MerR family DNA-binding transcriptional regulator [Chloroflexi bacterium]|nr:MerR family DNA-binding transcriptional regulator [Chloroflexota bacterium]
MNTHEVAKLAGIHRDTLLRWLRAGLVPEPRRDRRGWRQFTPDEARQIASFAGNTASVLAETPAVYDATPLPRPHSVLTTLDWDFAGATTNYLTHGLHPYPAKFIPQIPNALIQELSSVGDTVLDPFCGSGTTLVEALLLKRQAVGIDANPIACLISRAKTLRVTEADLEGANAIRDALASAEQRFGTGQMSFLEQWCAEPAAAPCPRDIEFWFEPHVIEELRYLRQLCETAKPAGLHTLAQASLSSIIISVSRQDSDTRYVRRQKHVAPGETVRRFSRALAQVVARAEEFSDVVEERFAARVIEADMNNPPLPSEVGTVDLVVCSPPYPNAYSYHLYHRTRMLWLGMDAVKFKKEEIGSHRKYSSRGPNRATVETFRAEMTGILDWIRKTLQPQGYCCLVVGDSTIAGRVIRNDQLLADIAIKLSFEVDAWLTRRLQDNRKSFNPKIGKIREEHILVLRNGG